MPPVDQEKDPLAESKIIVCRYYGNKKENENGEFNEVRYYTIKEALEEEYTSNLWYLGLYNPNYSFNLSSIDLPKNLLNISLTSCKIKSLKDITLPVNLKTLNLSKNHLKKLPDDLPDSLEILNISDNQIRKIWYFPKNLTNFLGSHNQIKSIPDKLPETLVEFSVEYNKLVKIPKKIPINMRYLIINNNQIEEIPESVIDCKNIEVRYENNNEDIFIPKKIKEVAEIYTQDINYCNFCIKNIDVCQSE
jgi:Leucine-rich repeat (LRR) protein